ncbi:MAG: carboxypeptidase-like regulatory domain-containing protein [Saprospiraceae bacterium]|nr:carboxypeptidase-like regulatory domain-containing protein [Saprospiraceae bacterium]HMX89493.1 carboxypeptidase-like regulatory domain-containing protein [Saprospiraceae bacterium]HMZ40875.1 carboxypeptidase-like regulatory domain-containing protein [Saprospiraceae bacterium]HNB31152.1 carboxypeptidase-like regulatory domain-containing protein [Saprospiraceae bacterium]HNC36354.1 carboxypeptidase-like regulatory domain-containing protein [Saprospiraceae bacterium]
MRLRTMLRFFLLVLLIISHQLSGQEMTRVKGFVRDDQTGDALEFVTVYIPESKYYTESNIKGFFEIEVPYRSGLTLRFNRVGYESKNVIVKERNPQDLDVRLIALKSEAVVITGQSGQRDNQIHEKASSFELLPNSNGGIERILPSIALGVRSSAGGELSSQYSVRGGSYDENLVFVNDFEIYRPQLIRNGQQEGLSFPHLDLIRDLSFSSGGFEARYGDKQSSVLDIRYKVPEEKKHSVEASLLGASVHTEGSIGLNRSGKGKLRYLIGARYKSNQYLLSSQDIQGEYVPRFGDVQAYVSSDINRNWQISFLGNWNSSRFSLIPESSAQARGSLLFNVIQLNTFYEGREVDYFNTAMGGLSLLYFPKQRKNNLFVKLQSSIQGSDEAEQFDILGYYRLVELELNNKDEEGKEIKLWGEGIQHRFARNYLQSLIGIHEVKAGLQLGHTEGFSQLWLGGLGVRNEKFEDQLNEWERIDSAGYSLPYQEGRGIVFNEVVKSSNTLHNTKIYGWIQNTIEMNVGGRSRINLVPGIRVHYNDLNAEWVVSPRIKAEWIPKHSKNELRVWIASGLYAQPPLYRELRNLAGNLNFDERAQKSAHFVAGLKRDFNWKKVSASKFRWISEIYYKSLWDQVSYDLDNVRIRYSGKNDSRGYAVGWDNRVNGEFVPGAESWVNLSLLRTRENIVGVQHFVNQQSDGSGTKVTDVPRPTDQLMSLSLFFQDYLPQNDRFKMHVQTTITTGLPYGVEGQNIVYRNEYRFKPYHRVDIGFSYKMWDEELRRRQARGLFRFSRNAWISLEVLNLLKVKNEASVRWIKSIYNYEFAIPNYLSSRRINLRLRIDF